MKNSFINKLFFKNKADISYSYDEPAQSELVEDNKGVIKKILAFFKLTRYNVKVILHKLYYLVRRFL